MKQKKTVVPIVMASDKNYLFPTSVAMTSILENANSLNTYVFYLLVNKELKGMDDGLFELMKQQYPYFEYHYLTVSPEVFRGASLTNYHVTLETYYRLLISQLLPEYDRCLYLDGDIIVQCDVAELLNVPMGDNYLAAVKDIGMQCGQGAYYTEHQNELGFDSMDSYFNAGILVFNLNQIRKDNMVPKFLKAIEKKYTIEDQDILNVTCKDRVYYLPVMYNMFSGFLNRAEFLNCNKYENEEIRNICNGEIKIIHYAGGKDKPWKNLRSQKADVWWKYVQLMPEIDWVNEKRNELEVCDGEYDFDKLLEKCEKYKNIVIYGYTYISRDLCDKLEKYGIKNVRFFCDKSAEKKGQMYRGHICVPFEAIRDVVLDDYLVIVATQQAYSQVRKELMTQGVEPANIARYFLKNEDYYKTLDRKYYEHEKKQIYNIQQRNVGNIGAAIKKMSYAEFQKKICSRNWDGVFSEIRKEFLLEKWCLTMPLISIVIPAYNVEKYIGRCLESVLAQSYSNWECIVINDGSKDKTEEEIMNWVKKDKRFVCYSQENMGMGPTRNKAIGLAKGEYVTFIDSDDWVEPDYVNDMFMAILDHDADACKCNFYVHDIGQNNTYTEEVGDTIDVLDEMAYKSPNMWCNMFDIRIFRKNQIQMPGIPMEDMAIYPLLMLKAEKVVSISRPLYHYQINTGTSVMDNVGNMVYYPTAIEWLLKEAERLQILDEYRDLFMRIAVYHMYGALNSRIKNNCSKEIYNEYKEKWGKFLLESFPDFQKNYDFNNYWLWGSYNLSRIVANVSSWGEKYNLGGKDLAFYFGFASIIPLIQNKDMKEKADYPITVENAMRQNMLDKEKNADFLNIKPEKNDFLLLDFLEERYDLLELEDGRIVTLNDIWLENTYHIQQESVLLRDNEEITGRWKDACDKFIELILQKFDESHIVLVENYLTPKCKNVKGLMLSWDNISEKNAVLAKYYEYFKTKMSKIKVIRVNEELDYTDGVSKYGVDSSYKNHMAHKEMAVKLKETIHSV